MTTKLIPLNALSIGAMSFSTLTKPKLHDLTKIRQSIEKDGLLYPLIVVKDGAKYLVIDGKKRLNVIRKLAKSKLYPRSTAKVPCLVQDTNSQDANNIAPRMQRRPKLLSGAELAHEIIMAAQSQISYASIAQRFECDITVVEDCISLKGLHPKLLIHFNNNAISLEQAAAFATIENMDAQLSLLHQLGPFVSDMQIIEAIRAGATVLELSEDNIIILPSRGRPVSKTHEEEDINKFGNRRQTTVLNGRIAA